MTDVVENVPFPHGCRPERQSYLDPALIRLYPSGNSLAISWSVNAVAYVTIGSIKLLLVFSIFRFPDFTASRLVGPLADARGYRANGLRNVSQFLGFPISRFLRPAFPTFAFRFSTSAPASRFPGFLIFRIFPVCPCHHPRPAIVDQIGDKERNQPAKAVILLHPPPVRLVPGRKRHETAR